MAIRPFPTMYRHHLEYSMTPDELVNRFRYHAPKEGQPERYVQIRNTALDMANLILELCPGSRERSLAVTSLEEVVFWANAAIARNE